MKKALNLERKNPETKKRLKQKKKEKKRRRGINGSEKSKIQG